MFWLLFFIIIILKYLLDVFSQQLEKEEFWVSFINNSKGKNPRHLQASQLALQSYKEQLTVCAHLAFRLVGEPLKLVHLERLNRVRTLVYKISSWSNGGRHGGMERVTNKCLKIIRSK